MNKLYIECEYSVEISTEDTNVLVIFKPTIETLARLKDWQDNTNLDAREISIKDAAGEGASRGSRIFVKLLNSSYHNTSVLTTL